MNKRQRKKFAKRGFVYHYYHFRKAIKLWVYVAKKHQERTGHYLEDWQKLELWRHTVNIVRHPNIEPFTWRYLRFARTLVSREVLNPIIPPKPRIVITERFGGHYYAPVNNKLAASGCEAAGMEVD